MTTRLLSALFVLALLFVPVHRSEEMSMNVERNFEEELIITVRKSHFDHVYEKLRFEEGNYVWDNFDFGRETYGGITRQYNPNWEGWKHIDAIKVQGDKQITKLKWNQKVEAAEPYVKEYYHDWWLKWNMDVIQDSLAAAYTFDFAICGTPSIKVIQSTLNSLGKHIKVDGTLSIHEAEMINELDPVIWVESLRLARKDFYHKISLKLHKVKGPDGKFLIDTTGYRLYLKPYGPVVIKDGYVYGHTQKKFLTGWLTRADRVRPHLKKRIDLSE